MQGMGPVEEEDSMSRGWTNRSVIDLLKQIEDGDEWKMFARPLAYNSL